MANGDDAIDAGMDVVLGTEDRRQGYDEINKSRDYIAQRTDPAALRVALSLPDQFVEDISVGHHLYLNWDSGAFRIGARVDVTDVGFLAYTSDLGGYVARSGDAMFGDLFLPTATAAVSGQVLCYLNGDGRVSRGSSSQRYKEDIIDVDPASIDGLFDAQLREFEMIGGDGSRIIGYIAEELDAIPDAQRFVIRVNGEIESIDFIQLLLAQVANLNARVEALEAAHG